MRSHLLLLNLQNFLNETLKDILLPNPTQGGSDIWGSARCFFGNVPDDDPQNMPKRFPFVVIRWMKGDSDEEGNNIDEVDLILGLFSPSGPDEAELVTAILLDHLRGALMRLRILAQTFDLQMPLKAMKPNPEKRQHPYHIATLATRWSFRAPRRPLKGDFDE